jgi:predicted lipase
MSGVAYRSTRKPENRFPLPTESGWNEIEELYRSLPSGFEAVSFQRDDEIVISFAGTYPEQEGDINTNGRLATGNPTAQLREAVQYYLDVKAQYPPDTKITLTGHSLGGGLASLVAVFFNEKAVTFDQAPFRNSAVLQYGRNLVVEDLLTVLRENNVSEKLLQPLVEFSNNPDILETRENKVTNQCVQGEFLSVAPDWILYDGIGLDNWGRTTLDA